LPDEKDYQADRKRKVTRQPAAHPATDYRRHNDHRNAQNAQAKDDVGT
jgi:hypothetical protein